MMNLHKSMMCYPGCQQVHASAFQPLVPYFLTSEKRTSLPLKQCKGHIRTRYSPG